MSFIIHTGKSSSTSNKPPPPEPLPDPELFPHTLEFPDRVIWVSVPQPDNLCLIVPVTPEIYADHVYPDCPVEEFVRGLGAYFQSEPCNAHHAGGIYYQNGDWRRATLQIGGRQSFVLFEKFYSKAKGYRLRIDLNPRKLGPKGFKQLACVLGGTNAPFSLGKLVKAAQITRLDICVDVVGLAVSEISGWHKEQGKSSFYLSPSGALETFYIYRKLMEPKPQYDSSGGPKKLKHKKNKALLRIYDRVAERKAVLAQPPFGPTPVTRIEMIINRFNKWKSLPLIAEMDDRFTKVRVGRRDSQIDKASPSWRNYTAMRRGLSIEEVRDRIFLDDERAKKFANAEQIPNPDIIRPKETWKGWTTGLTLTGLMGFINGEC